MDIYIVNNKVNQAKIAQRLESASECDYLIIVPNARQNNYSIAVAQQQYKQQQHNNNSNKSVYCALNNKTQE